MVSAPTRFQLLDVVALKEDLPQHHLSAGQVGTLVEPLAQDVFEVDFSDDEGQTYAMLPLHTSQLLKLYTSPEDPLTSAETMSNTIHQYGNGDNVAGDKVMGNKVGNQTTNNNQGANIGNLVNEARDNAQISAANFTQTSGASTAELLQIIVAMRQTVAQFPTEAQEDFIIDIDDVEEEVQKPENQRNLPKLKKRLMALVTAASMISNTVTSANNFADEVIELGNKVGIELQLPSGN
jgi:hypothetical protein